MFIADDDEEEADILAGNESASDDEPEMASSRSRKRKNDENDRGKKALLNKVLSRFQSNSVVNAKIRSERKFLCLDIIVSKISTVKYWYRT